MPLPTENFTLGQRDFPFHPAIASSNALARAPEGLRVSRLPFGSGTPWAAVDVFTHSPPPSFPLIPSPLSPRLPVSVGRLIRTGLGLKKGDVSVAWDLRGTDWFSRVSLVEGAIAPACRHSRVQFGRCGRKLAGEPHGSPFQCQIVAAAAYHSFQLPEAAGHIFLVEGKALGRQSRRCDGHGR